MKLKARWKLYTSRSYTHDIDSISFRLNGSLDSLRKRDRVGIMCTNTFMNEPPLLDSLVILTVRILKKTHFYLAMYLTI